MFTLWSSGFTAEQVEQVVKDFGRATKRVIEAGFDGVEIRGANHYLIQQFFSRFSNHRQDKWGITKHSHSRRN
ncbi:oxidoreductase [Lactobacillus johnsonii]|uniref:oxidoreductase n=1 Tax=Lactobacillus johnsonii TaxID=33959 RepID=UPI0021A3055A|nr:hypothetical protein [Lactobacillus johnsonii]